MNEVKEENMIQIHKKWKRIESLYIVHKEMKLGQLLIRIVLEKSS